MAAVLSKSDIQKLLKQKPPLIEGYIDLEKQLQPNGFDISLREISSLKTSGQLAASDNQRIIPGLAPLDFNDHGFIDLTPGAYTVIYNEIVNLPKNVMALARPRSSLLRCGVAIHTAVWDAGYSGRSQSLMVVYNSQGFRLQKDARIVQLIFFQLTGETDGYKGIYQGENI